MDAALTEAFGFDPDVAPVHFGGAGYLRIAAAPDNTPDHYDRLAGAVLDVLGQR